MNQCPECRALYAQVMALEAELKAAHALLAESDAALRVARELLAEAVPIMETLVRQADET
jgi:hypothetical protein